jgi:hypothetical protein
MRKLLQFLLILSCVSYDGIMLSNDTEDRCFSSYCAVELPKCCEEGHRGRRGRRGREGATGATGATGVSASNMGWLFLNSLSMTHSSTEGSVFVDYFFPYGSYPVLNGSPVAGYRMARRDRFLDGIDRVGINFAVPNDLDVSQPVTATFHFVVPKFSETPTVGNQGKLLIDDDFADSYQLIGITPPATGFVDSQTSADFLITEPVGFTENLICFKVSVPLNPSVMTPGDWAFLQLSRIAPAANEFQDDIYITTFVLQYSKIVS